jgi:glycogen operon protein
MEQLRWFKPNGNVADSAYLHDANNHAIAWRIDGTELGDSSSAIYIAYNGWSGSVDFTLPWPGPAKRWYRAMDDATWNEGPNTMASLGSETLIGGQGLTYGLENRALLVLIAK